MIPTRHSIPAVAVIKEASGEITFQVQGDLDTSGYCTFGYKGNSYVVTDLKLEAGETADSPINLEPAQLVRARVVGEYDPAPGGSIVRVFYRFFQNGHLLQATPAAGMVFECTGHGHDEREFDFST